MQFHFTINDPNHLRVSHYFFFRGSMNKCWEYKSQPGASSQCFLVQGKWQCFPWPVRKLKCRRMHSSVSTFQGVIWQMWIFLLSSSLGRMRLQSQISFLSSKMCHQNTFGNTVSFREEGIPGLNISQVNQFIRKPCRAVFMSSMFYSVMLYVGFMKKVRLKQNLHLRNTTCVFQGHAAF